MSLVKELPPHFTPRDPSQYPMVKAMAANTWTHAKVIPIERAKIPRLVRVRQRKAWRLARRVWP